FIVMLLLITGGVGVAKTGVDFLPETDEGFFTIDMELENGAKLDKTTDNIKEIEELLDKENDVKDYMAIAGSSEDRSEERRVGKEWRNRRWKHSIKDKQGNKRDIVRHHGTHDGIMS